MGVGAAGAHLGRDPDRFHQLLARGARTQGRLGMALDAIGALRDVRDGDRDELLCLARKGAVREHLWLKAWNASWMSGASRLRMSDNSRDGAG
jgi:hypothetical protein